MFARLAPGRDGIGPAAQTRDHQRLSLFADDEQERVDFSAELSDCRSRLGKSGWMPLVEGYEVVGETPEQIAVFFQGERLH